MSKANKHLELQGHANTILQIFRRAAVTTLVDPATGTSRKQTTPLALAPADEKIECMNSLLSAAVSFERCYRGKPLSADKPMADWECAEMRHDLAWVFRTALEVVRWSNARFIETFWVRELLLSPAFLDEELYVDALRRHCTAKAEQAEPSLLAILERRGLPARAGLGARIARESASTLAKWACRIEGDEVFSKTLSIDWFAGCADLPATLLDEVQLVNKAFLKVNDALSEFTEQLRGGAGFESLEARLSQKNQASELCKRLFGGLTRQQRELLRQHPELMRQYI